MKTFLPTTHLFAEITRKEKDGDTLIVEGYAYVNASVKSDKYNLTRSAMEAACEGYFEFPAIREMHGSSAAGTALERSWDDKGVKLTAKIVDPLAIKKVEQGVYRGFSVGVKPLVLRGNDVTKCEWIETSLVDRPADPDALILATRGEAMPAEVEVEVEDVERFDADIHILRSEVEEGFVARADHDAEIARVNEDLTVLRSERDTLQNDLTVERSLSASLKTKVEKLEKTPVAAPPTRYPEALVRSFAANQESRTEADDARAELARIEALPKDEIQRMTQNERNALALKVTTLKSQIASS